MVMFSFPPSILSSAQYSIVLTYEYSNSFSITGNKRTKTEKYSMKGMHLRNKNHTTVQGVKYWHRWKNYCNRIEDVGKGTRDQIIYFLFST
jgi:hypothetical protein